MTTGPVASRLPDNSALGICAGAVAVVADLKGLLIA